MIAGCTYEGTTAYHYSGIKTQLKYVNTNVTVLEMYESLSIYNSIKIESNSMRPSNDPLNMTEFSIRLNETLYNIPDYGFDSDSPTWESFSSFYIKSITDINGTYISVNLSYHSNRGFTSNDKADFDSESEAVFSSDVADAESDLEKMREILEPILDDEPLPYQLQMRTSVTGGL